MQRTILIFGAQGSGKGTQAEMLTEKFGFVYISTGNIFRREIEKKTELGMRAESYIRKGKLVPDEITDAIVALRLSKNDVRKQGCVLDGYPRNKSQMTELEKIVGVTDVVIIEISDRESVFRIGGRLICNCGRTYHTVFRPPKIKNICDYCGKKLSIREDDMPKSIKKRLEIYHKETEPLFEFYEKMGVVRRINGEQSIPDVFKDMVNALSLK